MVKALQSVLVVGDVESELSRFKRFSFWRVHHQKSLHIISFSLHFTIWMLDLGYDEPFETSTLKCHSCCLHTALKCNQTKELKTVLFEN